MHAWRLDPDARGESFHRIVGTCVGLWWAPLFRYRSFSIALLAAIVLLCAARAFIGLIGSRQFSHDAFMLFDGAWRMLNGQRPHIDFYSHLGVFSYVPTLAGLLISHGTAWGFGYGQALAGLLLGIWTYLLGRARLRDVPFGLLCITVTLLATAPFALGWFALRMGPSTTYNRYGYALVALCVTEAFTDAEGGRRKEELQGGLSTGLILGILFFLKITYFLAAIGVLAALIPCRRQNRERWTGLACGCLLAVLIPAGYFGFRMGPMLGDLITIAGGKSVHFEAYMLDEVLLHAALVLTFACIVALVLVHFGQRQRARAAVFLGVTVALFGTLLILGNSEESGFPLAAIAAILLLNEIVVAAPRASSLSDFRRVSVLLWGSVLIAGSLASSLLGICAAIGGRIHIAHKLPALHSPSLSGFIPAGSDFFYADVINDGLALVSQLRRPGDTIMSLDFSNPFSFGLEMKPASGGTTVLQYETTFNARFRPLAAQLFGAAQLVALPTVFTDGSLDVNVEKLYGEYLRSHFHLIGQSKWWRLYRQN